MGLDITAYQGLKIVADAELDENGNPVDWENHFKPGASMAWSEKHFPGRAQGVDQDAVYAFDKSFRFRAGSYSGYNEWRRMLVRMIGLNEMSMFDERDGPFAELINFADNEGVIGPIVSAKLAKDFADWQEKADQHPDEWFGVQYANWRKSFEMASDNGAVDFH